MWVDLSLPRILLRGEGFNIFGMHFVPIRMHEADYIGVARRNTLGRFYILPLYRAGQRITGFLLLFVTGGGYDVDLAVGSHI